MPLLDHFHAALHASLWPSFHTLWSAAIVERLNTRLSRRYLALCHIHLGRDVAADVAEFDRELLAETTGNGEGGVATAVWAPPVATHVIPAVFPDDIEVQVTDQRDGMTLVAVIELVSPSNKDRDDARDAFTDKCAAYLQRGVGVVVVDVVTERRGNLHNRLIERLRQPETFQMAADADLYATAYRPARRDDNNLIDLWLYRLTNGEALPTVPLALRGAGVVPLELEETYTRARQMSRL
jgi:hypothetical protein